MTNREYLKQELPLWLYNRIVPNSNIDEEFNSTTIGRNSFKWSETKQSANIDVYLSTWANEEETIADVFKKELWSKNKDFLFPCTVEEALSILELVEPEFYELLMARSRNSRLQNRADTWFDLGGVFSGTIQGWSDTPEGSAYWENKRDFSLSPEWIAEKTTIKSVKLEDVDEPHSIEWWRDELSKTEPEVAEHLYNEYVKQKRLSQKPKALFGRGTDSFLGGIVWCKAEFEEDIYTDCWYKQSFKPLKQALKEKSTSVNSVNSEMPGATFPCTVQERLDWMKTQSKLKPIAEYIIGKGVSIKGKVVENDFTNCAGVSFARWCCDDELIDTICYLAKSWEPFFDRFPHLRVKTVKPVELKKINEYHQLLVECANIKEVKQLLKHVNQEDAFTHSKRLVVFYDLDEKKIYHVGSTKKSHWKQILNKVHKKVSVEEFLAEVPMVKVVTDLKDRQVNLTIATVSPQNIYGKPVINTSSWFDDEPVETKKPNWFD